MHISCLTFHSVRIKRVTLGIVGPINPTGKIITSNKVIKNKKFLINVQLCVAELCPKKMKLTTLLSELFQLVCTPAPALVPAQAPLVDSSALT